MKVKRMVFAVLICLFLAGCGGAKYVEEKTLLTTVTTAMETFTSAISSAGAPAEITQAIGAFTGKIEEVLPKMKEMSDAHPDWKDNPPQELQGVIDKFKAATENFKSQAMPKIVQVAQENADNLELQDSLKKFGDLMSQL